MGGGNQYQDPSDTFKDPADLSTNSSSEYPGVGGLSGPDPSLGVVIPEAASEQGLFIGCCTEPPPPKGLRGLHPSPSGHLPREPLPPSLVAGGPWPNKHAHMTHIPPYLHARAHTHRHTHTLSRLWA